MKVLVTGHKGFIGSHFYSKYVSTHPDDEVYGIDLKDGQDFAHIDDPFNEDPFDLLVHFAADVSVVHSVEDPISVIKNNALKFRDLIENKWFKKIVFISTVGVYPEGENIKEEDADWKNCKSPYALSKMMAENYLTEMRCSCDYLIFRLSNVIGSPDRENWSVVEHFEDDNPIVVYGGEQTRDFIHVDDVVDSIIRAIDKDLDGIYTLASGQLTNILDLAKSTAIRRGVLVNRMPARDSEIKSQSFDLSKAKKEHLL